MSHQLTLPKTITHNQVAGQKGVNLIEASVLEMGYLWKPTSALTDAGIDGDIEIRNSKTGEATNFIIRVQSKATEGRFESENDETFVYRVKERDLNYWLRGNAPVILVAVRLETKELYWVPIKEYFNTKEKQATRKITFIKAQQRFNKEAAQAIATLALPTDQGIYMTPPPKSENLITNLLEVTYFPENLYIAQTTFSNDSLRSAIGAYGEKPGRLWFIKEKKLFSFHDLNELPWTQWCDKGTVEIFKSAEWAQSEDSEKRAEFVQLLNQALRTFTDQKEILPFNQKGSPTVYFFLPTEHFNREKDKWEYIRRDETWHSQKESMRCVAQPYYSKKNPDHFLFFRHHAFTGFFKRIRKKWYLEISPTYHYTSDGKTESPYRQKNLSGMKRQEGHQSVANNVRFLAYYLAFHDLLNPQYPHLKFGNLLQGQIEFGINENDWKNRKDADEDEGPANDGDENGQSELGLI